jgi:hypothetical protein
MIAKMVRKGVGWLALAVLISLPGALAWAGGSFAFEDLRPILNQLLKAGGAALSRPTTS